MCDGKRKDVLSGHKSKRRLIKHMKVLIYLFQVLHRFQHCTGHITMGSWKGRGKQYIQFIRVLYCKLPTNGKQLSAFPLEGMTEIEPHPQRWEARVLPLCHHEGLEGIAPIADDILIWENSKEQYEARQKGIKRTER